VLYSEKTFPPVFGPSSGAERLNAKNIWDEDHNAILEEIGTGEKVLIMMRKHHLVMHLGIDGSSSSSSSSEEDGNNQV
jgi:hypothetical protein